MDSSVYTRPSGAYITLIGSMQQASCKWKTEGISISVKVMGVVFCVKCINTGKNMFFWQEDRPTVVADSPVAGT